MIKLTSTEMVEDIIEHFKIVNKFYTTHQSNEQFFPITQNNHQSSLNQ